MLYRFVICRFRHIITVLHFFLVTTGRYLTIYRQTLWALRSDCSTVFDDLKYKLCTPCILYSSWLAYPSARVLSEESSGGVAPSRVEAVEGGMSLPNGKGKKHLPLTTKPGYLFLQYRLPLTDFSIPGAKRFQ